MKLQPRLLQTSIYKVLEALDAKGCYDLMLKCMTCVQGLVFRIDLVAIIGAYIVCPLYNYSRISRIVEECFYNQ